MNERIRELADKIWEEKYWTNPNTDKLLPAQLNRFAELIVRECMTINKVETTALDLPEYNLGMLEGYRRARENMSIHFGVEE
jgi:hypothetical protein